ncbi:MAG TPA: sigma-70 family RNA polymerase sigma factor [Chloroflexi bacterium]|nr:sigma-70 family RNA polymerase sigma factor [Chloroflexota bacterium]
MRYPVENQLISIQTDALAGQSDADLVRQARTTDGRAALAALYRRYLTPVYRYFYARTGDVQQAEDLTAQTFVAALEGLPRYRERGTFAGWLFTIAARRLADHFRQRPAAPLDDIADWPSPDPAPEALVEHAEQMACLACAVRTLSPDRAQVVALHFFAELSLSETARVMDRSRVAVKSLIHRALRDLRERLDDERE